MIVGYSDNNVLLIAIVEKEVEDLRSGLTLTYEGMKMLTKDIVVIYWRDREHVIEQLKGAGVAITTGQISDYLAGKRTDKQRKQS